jgi:L-rhamnose-H+ transport protein
MPSQTQHRFSIILGSCAAFGALLPLVILHPNEVSSRIGYHTFAGLAIIVIALICIAHAGMQKERCHIQRNAVLNHAQSPSDNSSFAPRVQHSSGNAPLCQGVILCLLSGLFSAALNFSLAFASNIRDSALALQSSDFGATSLVWALAVGCGGFIANAGFCVFLLIKNSSYRQFCVAQKQQAIILNFSDDYVQVCSARSTSFFFSDSYVVVQFDSTSTITKTSNFDACRTVKNVLCCCSMGCLWIGGYFLYGTGCSMMGSAATVLAWPMNLCASISTANACAWISGEWKHTSQQTRLWLLLGLLLLFAAASVMAA